MPFIIIIILVIIAVLYFLYRKYPKTAITISVLLTAVFGLIFFGLWALDIEDRYGANNNIYFDGKENDTVVMTYRSTKQTIAKGQIQRKTWDKVFIKSETDTLDLNDWIKQEAGDAIGIKCELIKNGRIVR